MNATQTEARAQYIKDIQQYIKVDEDKHGRLVCFVPSQSNPEGLEDGAWHTVHVDEKTTVPHGYHCSCEGVATYHTTTCCIHMQAVSFMYNRIYRSNVAKLQAKKAALVAKISAKIEATKAETESHNTPQELNAACQELREMKSVKVGQPGSVALAGKSKSNWTETAPLNGSKAFSVLR